MKIEKVYMIGVLKHSKNIIIVFVRSNAIADVIVDGNSVTFGLNIRLDLS